MNEYLQRHELEESPKAAKDVSGRMVWDGYSNQGIQSANSESKE